MSLCCVTQILDPTSDLQRERVLFIFRTDLFDKSSESPSDFRWGMDWLNQEKYEVSSINAPRRQRRSGYRLLFWAPDWFLAKTLRIGLPIEIYPMFRDQINSVDHIVCANDQISLAILWWRMLGKLNGKKIHCVVMSLPERVKNPNVPKFVNAFVAHLLRHAYSILTLSQAVREEFQEVFGIVRSKIHPIYFGVDPDFWSTATRDRADNVPFALAIGNDLNRDYESLVRALPSGIPLKIVTQQKVEVRGLEAGQNIQIMNEWLTNVEVRELYRKATLVIIPIKPVSSESTGLSTILQAMACGAPVITADGRTIRELFEANGTCVFYKAGDSRDLAVQIRRLWNSSSEKEKLARKAGKHVGEEFTSAKLAGRISTALSS